MRHLVLFVVLFAGQSITTSFGWSGGEVRRRGQLSVRDGGEGHADCYSDGDCYRHDCDPGHISYCSSRTCHCKRGCSSDYHCHSHHCRNGETQYCSSGRCHCRASTTITGTSGCTYDTDCSCGVGYFHSCSAGKCHCIATATTTKAPTGHILCYDNSDCVHNSCPGEHMAPTCVETVVLIIFRSRVCICQALTTSTAATTPTIVTTAPPTIHSTESPRSTVPTTESPKSTSACHSHADCIGHLCQGNQHPYCKIDLHSSVCHCTACTEDSHCYCPQGLVGTCHFSYFARKHECVCAIAPETTSTTSATTQTFTSSTTQAKTTVLPTTTDIAGTKTTTGKPTNIVTTRATTVTGTPSTTQTVTTQAQTTGNPSTTQTVTMQAQTTGNPSTGQTVTTQTQTTGNPSTTQTTTITTTEKPSTTAQTVTTQAPTTLAKSTTANFTTTPLVTQPTSQQLTGTRTCHVCGDSDNGIPCTTQSIYLGSLQKCASGEDFCMTDLLQDGQQYPKTFKRCVTELECRNKWLHQTSDLDHCTDYGNTIVNGQFSCHFCCTSDGCNSGQLPDKSTLYIKA